MNDARELTQTVVNDSATSGSSDTAATHARSGAVHPLTADLIRKRNEVGAISPLGKRYSLLDAQLREGAPTPLIANTVREIEQIQRDGGYVHENHGAGK